VNIIVTENDESAHGIQRWHLVNANGVRELANTVTLNGSSTLTNPIVTFPTAVASVSGNQSMQLNWNAVSGASSYNVRYSANNGGPFLTLAPQYARNQRSYRRPGQWRDLLLAGGVTAVTAEMKAPPRSRLKHAV